MHNMDDETRKQVLGEALMDELKVIREYVEDIPEIKKDVVDIKERVITLEGDMKVVKAAVTDQSKELKRHALGIRQLKHKAA